MRRKRVGSYTDLGPVQIPPLPQNIVMQGRDDFLMYFLSHTGDPGSLAFLLSTVIPSSPDTIFYGPDAGPYLNGNIKLFVSGGTLQGELVVPDRIFNASVLTRRAKETTFLQITAPALWQPGDSFIFTEIDV